MWGIQFDNIEPNVKNRIGSHNVEYDIVLYNGHSIGIVEVKSKAHINDLKSFDKKIEDFRIFFPMYKDNKIYIGLASLHFNEEVINAW